MSDILLIAGPILVLLGALAIGLLLESFGIGKSLIGLTSILAGFISLILVIMSFGQDVIYIFITQSTGSTYYNFWETSTTITVSLLKIDNFYRFFSIIFLIVFLFVAISSLDYMSSEKNIGVFYGLLILCTIGMMLVAASNDILALFVAWELGSLPAYSLVAYQKTKKETSESSLKFFLYGAMSSAFILFGISIIFGIAGATDLSTVMGFFANMTDYTLLHILALVFIITGMGYKIAAVPFHAWAVDVYQGAPTVMTAYLAAGSKAMGFAAILRIVTYGMTELDAQWGVIFAVLSVITMTLGNVVALAQENIKRMLAFSSIAHAGYILIAMSAMASDVSQTIITGTSFTVAQFSVASVEMHLLTHAIMKSIAFIIVIVITLSIRSEDITAYSGLRKRHRWISLALTISLLSLLGIPGLIGFISKMMLFISAIYADMFWLAVIGVINSAISVFYYVRVIKLMYFDNPPTDTEELDRVQPVTYSPVYNFVILTGTLLIIIFGIYPTPIIDMALTAARSLL